MFFLTFLVTEPNELVLTEDFTEHQNVLCLGILGEISLLASGGTPLYSFSLDNLNFQSSSSFNSLPAGVTWFYIQDANNCQDSLQLTITQPTLPLSVLELMNAHQDVSYSDNDGQFEVVGGEFSLSIHL